ncbi:DUF2844 domain-containing protein [Paraburkholderia tropica]|uniref:Uncharacterized protein DUF2844 n=1 Tax=Paraburkholderia tropica TaxID=92647 RepID=A0A1A5WZR1_9BURK|nr:DUF2844 domain-containing protein [Paraburkholderia tropica]MBB2977886.1 hypothetical protein [Paraburkholderia tropica]MBB2998428.1 hypothetical protein [Paraburkholderia tropica]MBB6317470.1 hypothetical protein [Paraburkholderia tropica]MDE1142563.1 DUF2844 domain-containing protein [Paraburkholderia tropica]OBR46761.1 hypothetical protein A6456_29830 [Paraburkholderia tropica]
MAALVCAAGVLFVAQPASAALGGAPMATPAGATVGAPSAANTAVSAVKRQAVLASAAAASTTSTTSGTSAYTVRETTLANGTVVREYLSSAGTVFGVAWNGPQPPDLASLLGSYFPQYVAGVKANRAAGVRGPGAVDSSALVVHSGGHMGAFSGEAWLPQALPSGVSASDIQ